MATEQAFANATRREVALVVSERPRTLYEIAKALGRPSGSIAQLVRRMHADGLLLADNEPPVRGTSYTLNPAFMAALEAAVTSNRPPGMLERGQSIVLIDGDDVEALHRILARPALAGCVVWATRGDATGRMLLALDGASSSDPDELLLAFKAAGFRCRDWTVGEIIAGHDLRRRAAGLVERIGSRT
jgi:hypothetical protein